jgi:hypothetical protein
LEALLGEALGGGRDLHGASGPCALGGVLQRKEARIGAEGKSAGLQAGAAGLSWRL